MPRMFEMLGDVRGRRVLDLGCGEGGYSRELALRGASIIGVDGSARLIEVARERALAAGVEADFRCANANALESIPDSSLDLVLASMSLMDIEDYSGAVWEVCRVLMAGGELLMSITHPCFSGPTSEWVHDEAGATQYFAVDRYFERSVWDERITQRFRVPVVRRHRPLEDYMGELLKAGLMLREFQEPSATVDDLKSSARFEHLTRIPYFLFMRWTKM